MGGTVLSVEYVEVKLPASQLRFGDRLIDGDGDRGQLVMQVSARDGVVDVSHPSGRTKLIGDPLVRVLRRKPRVVEDELPAPVWRPLGPRRIQPWENDT